MTLTAAFESYEDMMSFARSLAGNESLETTKFFLNGGEVYRQSGVSLHETPEEPAEDREQPVSTTETTREIATEDPEDEEPKYTLVQVRGKLAELQKAGKRAQVQDLIAYFGVKKLTEVPEDRYTELMQKAGEL